MEVDTIYANSTLAIEFIIYLGQDKLKDLNSQSLLEADADSELTAGQEYLNKMLGVMIDANFSGLEKAMVVMPSSPSNPQATVIAANDSISSVDLPDSLIQGAAAGSDYLWTDDELPGMGSNGQNLIISKEVDLNGTGLKAYFIAVKPMETEITALNQFFDEKKRGGSINLALMIIICIAGMSILTFIFLSLLIRSRVTRPIDELHKVADEVMTGNLDVEIPVRKGEEFEGLKHTFNTMIRNLKVILFLPMSGENAQQMEELTENQEALEERAERVRSREQMEKGFTPRRSRTLYYITAFLIVIFIASGLASFLVFNRWQSRLINEGTDKMIQRISEYFINESDFIRHSLDPVITETLIQEGMRNLTLEEQYALALEKKLSEYQMFYNAFAKELVDRSALDLQEVMVILTGVGIPNGAMVVVSSDESLIYNWVVPEYLVEAIKDDIPYLYFSKGIPELGMEGELTVIIETFDYMSLKQAYMGIKSMHAEVEEMRNFYNQEKKSMYLWLIPIIILSLIAFILLTFVTIDFLLRRNITRPVDELSAAAEQVMQGNLDVEISVREGEDLAELKHAFREMVESLRKLIAISTED